MLIYWCTLSYRKWVGVRAGRPYNTIAFYSNTWDFIYWSKTTKHMSVKVQNNYNLVHNIYLIPGKCWNLATTTPDGKWFWAGNWRFPEIHLQRQIAKKFACQNIKFLPLKYPSTSLLGKWIQVKMWYYLEICHISILESVYFVTCTAFAHFGPLRKDTWSLGNHGNRKCFILPNQTFTPN